MAPEQVFACTNRGEITPTPSPRGNRGNDRRLRSSNAADSGKGRAMHQIVSASVDSSSRWWGLAIVVAAQFMFGVDAFIVNVAIPTIAIDLQASPAQIESVIAIYLIAYATLVVTGGRLGEIYGTKNVFLGGVLGFTLMALWCGLAQSGSGLIAARLAQGATAALMVPQVLATLHLLFVDASRARAFAVYGT